jgi:hypothetical protein
MTQASTKGLAREFSIIPNFSSSPLEVVGLDAVDGDPDVVAG